MKAFVTGATGFLGGNLCLSLLKHGWDVSALVRDIKAYAPVYKEAAPNITEIYGYLGQKLLERCFSQYKPDVVFHLAAQPEVGAAISNPVETFETNIQGTWNILEACRKQNVQRLIVASTDKVYGISKPPYIEETIPSPIGPYESSKFCADILASSYQNTYGLNIAITRCGNLFGPGHLNWTTLIPYSIRASLNNQPIILRSDGSHKRDFLYVGDAVDGYLKLADSRAVGIFNFGNNDPRSVKSVAEDIRRICKSEAPVMIFQSAHKTEIQDQAILSDRAKSELGWSPKFDWEIRLDSTIAWYSSYLGRK